MKSKFDSTKHHRPFGGAQGRHSIRLKGYDYTSEGAYFITIVTQGCECLFGEIVDGKMILNETGKMILKWWHKLPNKLPNVTLGAFVIMPNHFHGIIFITDERRGEGLSPRNNPNKLGGETPPLRKPTLGQIVGYFKYQSTKEMNMIENTGTIAKLWQRNYYEHIVRNEKELQQKTDYILCNPFHWTDDEENPRNKKSPGLF